MDSDVLGNVSQALDAVAPFILIPAAGGAVAAGLFRRNRLAVALLILAVVAVVAPLAVGAWWGLSQPLT